FAIPSGVGSNNDIVEGPDGNMWVTTETTSGVPRITPDGAVTEFTLPSTSFGIESGPDGNLWRVLAAEKEQASQVQALHLAGEVQVEARQVPVRGSGGARRRPR